MDRLQWNKYFNEKYYKNLNHPFKQKAKFVKNIYQRGSAYRLIFDILLQKKIENFNIVETGTCRSLSWSDGQSTIMFADFVEKFGGHVQTVDINPEAVLLSKKLLQGKKVTVNLGDSISWLSKLDKNNIDLFFLDSFDVKWKNDKPSAKHHLNEFFEIEPYIDGSILAIDDNVKNKLDNGRAGKGRLIYEYLLSKNIKPIYDEYIIVYNFT